MVKVADFGLSVVMTGNKNYFRGHLSSTEKLPVKWMAPESLSDRKFSEYSDVVSLHVIVFCGLVTCCATDVTTFRTQ